MTCWMCGARVKREVVPGPLKWDLLSMYNLIGEKNFRSKYPIDKYLKALDSGQKLPEVNVCQIK